jgi:Uma2 family endonuclease
MSLKEQDKPFHSEIPRKYTLREYFEFEEKSEIRHEYHDGIIVPITAATENHGRIVSNFVFLFQNCLRETDCDVFTGDRTTYVKECNKVFYPDVLIVCGKREYYEHSKNVLATTNPSVIVEVISESTYASDRGKKLRCYRKLKSLKQYVIVEQDFINLEVYEQDENGRWISKIYEEEDDTVLLNDCELLLKDLYWKVEFPTPERISE